MGRWRWHFLAGCLNFVNPGNEIAKLAEGFFYVGLQRWGIGSVYIPLIGSCDLEDVKRDMVAYNFGSPGLCVFSLRRQREGKMIALGAIKFDAGAFLDVVSYLPMETPTFQVVV